MAAGHMKARFQRFMGMCAVLLPALYANGCTAQSQEEDRGTVQGSVTGALAHRVAGFGTSCTNFGHFTIFLEDTVRGVYTVLSGSRADGTAPRPGSYSLVPLDEAGPGQFEVWIGRRWLPHTEDREVDAVGGTLTLSRVDSTRVVGDVQVALKVGDDQTELKDYMTDTTPDVPDAPPSPADFSARSDVPWGTCRQPKP